MSDYFSALRKMSEWYRTPLGKVLLQHEKKYYDDEIKKTFGFNLLQLGGDVSEEFWVNTSISNRIIVYPELTTAAASNIDNSANGDKRSVYSVIAEYEELPFLYDSIDVVVISHILEFIKNPHLVLEEAYHVLGSQGKLIVFSFNPRSFLEIWRIFHGNKKEVPWLGRFINASRMRKWLGELGFSIIKYRTFCFEFPIAKQHASKHSTVIERVGAFICPFLGGISMFVAEKRLTALTPIKERSLLIKRKLSEGIV
jgi:SAM-dependent methyltransferase